jgi:hypothetical protein
MTVPVKNLPTLFDQPDTVASVMLNGTPLTYSDDDQADELPFPDDGSGNRASLFRVYSSSANTYHIGVSGYDDQGFDGTATGDGHPETGTYALTLARINPTVLGGAFLDTDPTNNSFVGADAISIGSSGASVAVSQLLANDVDYYALNLTQGQIVSFLTAPLEDLPFSFDVPDTLIGLFNSSGTEIASNDDAGDEGLNDLNPDLGSDNPIANATNVIWGSAMRVLVPATGVYYLGVTGYGDDGFTGGHSEFGKYGLLVGTVTPSAPTPGDFDNNGVSDARDYVIWRKGFGTLYDIDDYNDWRANFGSPPGTGSGDIVSGGQVPEPASMACLLIAVCAMGRRRWIERRT